MTKKTSLILFFIIFIISIFALIIYFFYNKDEDKTLLEKYQDDIIKRELYPSKVAEVKKTEEVDLALLNEMKSFVRALCSMKIKPGQAINSKYFIILREKIKLYKEKYKDNDNFDYKLFPQIVYENCSSDDNFKENIIIYSQMEGEINVTNFEEYQKDTVDYVKNITFSIEGIEQKKLINDKNYFDEYFLNKELKNISALYHPYYVKNNKEYSRFLNKPRDMGNLDIKAESIFSLEYNLKTLGIKSIDDFKKIIKNHYPLDLKEQLLKDYEEFSKLSKSLGYDTSFLEDESYAKFQNYIKTGEFNKFLSNEKLKTKLNSIYKKMILFDILGNDYSDNYTEKWQAEQYFGNKEKGNALIRLKFIYFTSL